MSLIFSLHYTNDTNVTTQLILWSQQSCSPHFAAIGTYNRNILQSFPLLMLHYQNCRIIEQPRSDFEGSSGPIVHGKGGLDGFV